MTTKHVIVETLIGLLAVTIAVSALDECFQPEHCDKITMTLDMDSDGDDIALKWTYNSSETFYGFQIKIFDSDSEVIYESPILHIFDRRMDFMTDLPSGKNYVCLQVLNNATHIIAQTCDDLKINDLKIIVGILAGTIFLVPCLIILAVFIYKDKKIRNSNYQKLMAGYGNKSFESEEAAPGHKLTYTAATKHKTVQAVPVMEINIEIPNTNKQSESNAHLKALRREVENPPVVKADQTKPELDSKNHTVTQAEKANTEKEEAELFKHEKDGTEPQIETHYQQGQITDETNSKCSEAKDEVVPKTEETSPNLENNDPADLNADVTKPKSDDTNQDRSNTAETKPNSEVNVQVEVNNDLDDTTPKENTDGQAGLNANETTLALEDSNQDRQNEDETTLQRDINDPAVDNTDDTADSPESPDKIPDETVEKGINIEEVVKPKSDYL